MQTKTRIFFTSLALCAFPLAFPAGSNAQPEGQSYVYFGEDSGGTSYLGVDTSNITPDRVGALHLSAETGVEITMVDQDAPAGKAGLKEHDVILTINDQKIESEEQLRRVIHEIPPGRTISIGISRDGQPMTLKAQLAARKMDHDFNFNMPAINVPAVHIPPINMPEIDVPSVVVIHSPRSSGIMVENLTPQLGEYFGVKSGNGVLIRSVERGSRAEQAGLRAGDVIVRVNGSAVTDCSDFTRLLRDRKEGKAQITVIRDHKEQNLSLSLPPRRSGSLENCAYGEEVTCAHIINGNANDEVAALLPQLKTAEIKRLKPQMEQLKKQMQKLEPTMEELQKQYKQQMESEGSQMKTEMQELQREFGREQEEVRREVQEWVKHGEI
jgi:membrane-associated protease RseP (regulator of RpoE activity)